MVSKQHLQLKEFLAILCSLKNGVNWVQAPGGHALVKFLSEKTKRSQVAIAKKIEELTELKYIEKDFRGKKGCVLWRIRILNTTWDENCVIKKTGKGKKLRRTSIGSPPESQGSQNKKFAIFLDFVNLEKNMPKSADKFRDFSWLLNPILEKGKLIFAFVFIPDHYVSRAPIMQLTHKHRFHPLVCPRQILTGGSTIKDADTVDAQMHDLGYAIIDNSDITDLIIVSGDADFQRLATHAIWQQKSVTVVSASKALSGRFLEMAGDGSLSVQLL